MTSSAIEILKTRTLKTLRQDPERNWIKYQPDFVDKYQELFGESFTDRLKNMGPRARPSKFFRQHLSTVVEFNNDNPPNFKIRLANNSKETKKSSTLKNVSSSLPNGNPIFSDDHEQPSLTKFDIPQSMIVSRTNPIPNDKYREVYYKIWSVLASFPKGNWVTLNQLKQLYLETHNVSLSCRLIGTSFPILFKTKINSIVDWNKDGVNRISKVRLHPAYYYTYPGPKEFLQTESKPTETKTSSKSNIHDSSSSSSTPMINGVSVYPTASRASAESFPSRNKPCNSNLHSAITDVYDSAMVVRNNMQTMESMISSKMRELEAKFGFEEVDALSQQLEQLSAVNLKLANKMVDSCLNAIFSANVHIDELRLQ